MSAKVTRKEVEEVLDGLVIKVKERIEKRNGRVYANRFEALGKITEEYSELTDAIRKEKRKDIKDETIDLAEACVYFLSSELAKKKARKKRKKAKNKEA